MKTRSFILYGSFKKLSNVHRLVSRQKQVPYYIRIKQVNCDMNEALSSAKPKRGETVLNSIPIS